jgi:serpin B
MRASLLTLCLAGLAACADSTGPTHAPDVLTGLPRALTAAEQDALAGSTSFGLQLFRTVSQAHPGENVLLSPLSASFALGMALNGAAGATRDSMRAALGWGTRTDQEINEAYLGLATLLPSLDPQVQFTSANSMWADNSFPVLPAFVSTNRTYFGARIQNLDFSSSAAVPTINAWVSDATRSRIPTIIDQIDPSEVMFLINAIWFKGSWRARFDPANTRPGWFRNAAGDSVSVPMMHRTGDLRLIWGPTYYGGEQRYGNGAYSMIILMPNAGATLEQVVDSVVTRGWAIATRDTSRSAAFTSGDVTMPRFTLKHEEKLNDALTTLGMGIAFDQWRADFTRIANTGNPIWISRVQQKTWMDVNEEGTEAAAVTSVGIATTVSMLPPALTVDRAFVVAIRERFSGAILFIGKVAKLP